jgi:hypothetical protein
MTPAEIWKLILAAAGIFGGITVVSVGVAAFLAKFIADKSIEKHKAALGQETERLKAELNRQAERDKLRLKKEEIIFNKQLDAASDFMRLHKKLRPAYNHPDKDWGEACAEAAGQLGEFEDKLEEYFQKYGPVLSEEVRRMLRECISKASNYKFATAGYGNSGEGEKAAGNILDNLEKIEEQMLKELQS